MFIKFGCLASKPQTNQIKLKKGKFKKKKND